MDRMPEFLYTWWLFNLKVRFPALSAGLIFTFRQFGENPRAAIILYMAFLDLAKAFASVHHPTLWEILLKYDCPDKLATMIGMLEVKKDGIIAPIFFHYQWQPYYNWQRTCPLALRAATCMTATFQPIASACNNQSRANSN